MRVEFLDDLTEGGKYPQAYPTSLLRLYDFDLEQAQLFRDVVQKKVIDLGQSLNLASESFIEEVNCSLELRIAESDAGVTTSDFKNFYCNTTLDGYREMLYMMEPFCDPAKEDIYNFQTYQWLYDPVDEEIDLLFSPDGHW